jgi:NADPH-dependent 2,4-dienoyl-CoA reductase/sulfur reductase-like enzyme/rhodanese-related sulfurtransferase
MMKIVIVGGVAGGASAATRARRLDERAEIVLLERGHDVSFANCGLPYYLGGEIVDRDKLLVAKPSLLRDRFKIDVRVRASVESIDRASKTVAIRYIDENRVEKETYDKLILSTGASPIVPPIPGIDLPGVFTLRDLRDVDRIHARLESGVRRVLILGAGYIGLELVENMVRRGFDTTVVDLADQILAPFDKEMTTPIVEALAHHQVGLRLGRSAKRIEKRGGGLVATLDDGEEIAADLVLVGIGVRPESDLAKAARLAIGARGGVQVDDHMRTTDPDIYAVGDVVEVRAFVTGAARQIPLAGPANRQGRIAADHIFGRDSKFRGSQGTAIVRVFDVVAAQTGEIEKTLRASGLKYEKIYVHPNQHAGYYPGAKAMTIKLLFRGDDGAILGAQIVGADGVDKRIDVLATAIQARMTVFDLEEVELAYSPQFGSAKDAINMAGFVAAGVARRDYPQTQVEEMSAALGENGTILDVRTIDEHRRGAIESAIHIPIDSLRDRLNELPRDRPIVVYCHAGQRGYVATRMLRQEGFNAINLAGGFRTYRMIRPDPGLNGER